MSINELEEIIEALREILTKIEPRTPQAEPTIICRPGTLKAYFNPY